MSFARVLLVIMRFVQCYSHAILELRMITSENQTVAVKFSSTTSTQAHLEVEGPMMKGIQMFRINASLKNNYTITISAGKSEKHGIRSTVVRIKLPPHRVFLVPEKVMPPLTGLFLMFQCEFGWYGEHCDVYCDDEIAMMNDRKCHSTGIYRCPPGMMGRNCTDGIQPSFCGCKSEGICHWIFPNEVGELVCTCPEGLGGPQCERDINVPVRMSTYSMFNEPIPPATNVDDFYESKMVKNKFGKPYGKVIR